MQGGDGRARPDRVAVTRQRELPAFSAFGAETWKWTSPTGFSAVPPPGPATPVTAIPTSAPSRAAHAGRHRARRPRPTRRRAGEQLLGHAELRDLHLVRVRDDAADERRRSSRARRSAGPRPCRRCRTRRSPASSPCARQSSSTISAIDRSSSRTGSARAASAAPAASSSPRRSAPGSTTRSTWISKSRAQIVASTPSPSPPASASAWATADSLAPKNRRTRRPGRPRRREHRLHRLACDGRGPQPAQLARRPGSTTNDAAVRGRRPGPEPSRRRRSRRRRRGSSPASSRPAAKSAYGRPRRSATERDTASICVSSSLDRPGAPRRRRARRARPSGRRASGPGRRRRGRHRPRSRSRAPPRDRCGSSPTMTIRSGVEPERQRLTRVERTVPVVALSAHELAARDDDRRARSCHPAGANRRRPLRGMTIRWPFTFTTTFPGRATER